MVAFHLTHRNTISITRASGHNMNGEFMQTFLMHYYYYSAALFRQWVCMYVHTSVCGGLWLKVCGKLFASRLTHNEFCREGEMFCNVSCLHWCAAEQTTESSEEKFNVTTKQKATQFFYVRANKELRKEWVKKNKWNSEEERGESNRGMTHRSRGWTPICWNHSFFWFSVK